MPANYPTLASAAGTTISISLTAPANHDVAGFDGITGWKEIGAVVNSGGFPRQVRSYDDIDLLDGTSLVLPQNERMEPLNVEAVYQGTNPGQVDVASVSGGMTVAWFRWQTPAGRRVYCAGYVTGYGENANTSQDYVAAMFTIRPIFDANKVGVVRSQVPTGGGS